MGKVLLCHTCIKAHCCIHYAEADLTENFIQNSEKVGFSNSKVQKCFSRSGTTKRVKSFFWDSKPDVNLCDHISSVAFAR